MPLARLLGVDAVQRPFEEGATLREVGELLGAVRTLLDMAGRAPLLEFAQLAIQQGDERLRRRVRHSLTSSR